ncbi:hypothetical protein BH09ACT3_BH09ACT3_16700 [soil metagenome]
MKRTGPLVLAAALSLGLALSACASAAPDPTPTPTAIDTTKWIGGVVDPIGTRWTGTDSAGDATTFVLAGDGSVDVTYGENSFDEPTDSWSVTDGVLALDIHIDAVAGRLHYSGRYDPTAKTIAATGTSTISKRTITVTLTQG